MDVLRFVNSKDIRNYLKEIGYKFNSLEAAWLIWQCHDATIREKHKAWNELIETMPDCIIEERHATDPQDSLHDFLKKYMEVEDRLINDFLDEKHADTFDCNKPFVFRFNYIYEDGSEFDCNTVFSCFDALYETFVEPEGDVIGIICIKMQIDRLCSPQIAYLTPNFDILNLSPGELEDVKDIDIYYGVFDGLWFEFPTPFKKGDIVWKPKDPNLGHVCGEPFVTNGVCLDGIENDKVRNNLKKNGDITDMNAGGYFLSEDGKIYLECMSDYMDLEFYEEELTGQRSTLISLSNCLKGKISPVQFAQEYQQIITESNTCNLCPDIVEVIQEYIEFCKGVSKQEAIKYIYENICYDYDLREDPSIYAYIKLLYEC